MARKKISEFAAKKLLYDFLQVPYGGITVDTGDEYYESLKKKMKDETQYVLKVDQGIKQRKKKGLVTFGITKDNVKGEIEKLQGNGFTFFILEEFIEHEGFGEYYLAVERVREGKKVYYSTLGGINIEDNKDSIKTVILKVSEDTNEIALSLQIDKETLENILTAFDDYYFSFLEINPLVVKDGKYYFLDTAVEVDTTADFFVNGAWGKKDYRESSHKKTMEERSIEELKEKSPASFSYNLLNPDGSIFLLLSGGGASLVTADEIYQAGAGKSLANYGEYSGNPNAEETYIYTKNVLKSLLLSSAHKKAIIISGGVANFTDVRITFKGIIKALGEVSSQLQEQQVKVFVRRGGPHQEEGLSLMKKFLEENNLMGEIHGPELTLTDIVAPALRHIA